MTKTTIPLLALMLAAGAAQAQTNGGQPRENQGGNWLTGYWGGHVICRDGNAWTIFHDIRAEAGGTVSDYYYFGSSRDRSRVDIFVTDTVLIFAPRESNVHGWHYARDGQFLIGTARGTDCRSRLAAIGEDEFRYATGSATR